MILRVCAKRGDFFRLVCVFIGCYESWWFSTGRPCVVEDCTCPSCLLVAPLLAFVWLRWSRRAWFFVFLLLPKAPYRSIDLWIERQGRFVSASSHWQARIIITEYSISIRRGLSSLVRPHQSRLCRRHRRRCCCSWFTSILANCYFPIIRCLWIHFSQCYT